MLRRKGGCVLRFGLLTIGITLGLFSRPLRAAESAADFYVSPQGNDRWSGRLPQPNADKNDGPLAGIHQAQQLVRELKTKEPARARPIVVQVRGGTYCLPGTLSFGPDDSGSQQAPVVYEAYPGERPVFSGGSRIENWRLGEAGRWEAELPDVKSGKWSFSQLFVGNQRRFRPQLPKQGYYQIGRTVGATPKHKDKGYDSFGYANEDMRPDWTNREDIEVVIFHEWFATRLRVATLEPQRRVVTFTGCTPSRSNWAGLFKGHRYQVANVREALSEPGQWYLDRPNGRLFYLPLPGEQPDKTPVFAPRHQRLVTFEGNVKDRRWVQHIRLRGLTLAHANYLLPPEGHAHHQADVNLDAAISATAARDVAIEGCAVRHVGGYAMAFGAGCRDNRVENCELVDLGGGGIKIGHAGTESRPQPGRVVEDLEELASHHTVRQCLIAHGGRVFPSSVGLWIAHSHNNKIQHNDIHDFYYTGISVGWSWGYGKSQTHSNDIGFNHVHTIGQGVLSDMGGIYTLGISPGTVIHDNCFHDVQAFGYGGWGIYTDEGSSGILIENNVVYRTKSSGFHQHYGKENQVRNNIFALAERQQFQRTKTENHISFIAERNIIYGDGGSKLFGGNFKDNNFKLDYNVYWHAAQKGASMFGGADLNSWRKSRKQDEHSIIADPLFAAPEKGDFRLQPGSPALEVGFKPLDASKAGRSNPPVLTADLPPVPRAFW